MTFEHNLLDNLLCADNIVVCLVMNTTKTNTSPERIQKYTCDARIERLHQQRIQSEHRYFVLMVLLSQDDLECYIEMEYLKLVRFFRRESSSLSCPLTRHWIFLKHIVQPPIAFRQLSNLL